MTQRSGPNAASRSRLEARALRWHRAGRRIVDGVDLDVARGEIVGLLGPNGAGKTVTLSMIVGLLSPTSGRVYLDGEDVTGLGLHERARRGLGFLPQERSVFRHLSAENNIAAIVESRGGGRHAAHERAHEILAEFGLLGVADRSAQRLSGGEQRRLEVARSLATEPRFLLADEPFAGIDPLTIESLHAMLVDARARGVGVLLTDHNVREALALCDRAYVLFQGRVLAMGNAGALMADPEVRRHFLGESFAMEPG
ncbi:MAG TPA: LPS export ABC transporter ATP-binding protein [Gemmatimonadaceae bacterium]|nr:LPS export ABC transporter ATP-binding protein [Gemmatimonadaceae bacterium]